MVGPRLALVALSAVLTLINLGHGKPRGATNTG